MQLLQRLTELYPDSSKRTLKQWIQWGRVQIDDRVAERPNEEIVSTQIVSLIKKEIGSIPVLYKDRDLIVINKPAGLLSVPAEKRERSALIELQERFGTLYAVHRLDQETSGALMFARTPIAKKALDPLFREHAIKREYLAVVEGFVCKERGSWEHYLEELPSYDVVVTKEEYGRRAITHFEVIRRTEKFSILKLKLETGRKHQIRVQCREVGHPIVGDFRYDAHLDPLKRIGLHACQLSLIHPFSKRKICAKAPLPTPFKKVGAGISPLTQI